MRPILIPLLPSLLLLASCASAPPVAVQTPIPAALLAHEPRPLVVGIPATPSERAALAASLLIAYDDALARCNARLDAVGHIVMEPKP